MLGVDKLKSLLADKREASVEVVTLACEEVDKRLCDTIKYWCGMGPSPTILKTLDNEHLLMAVASRLKDLGFTVERASAHNFTLKVGVKE